MKKCKILYVDDALSMGGSLVVISQIIRYLSNDRYEKILLTPLTSDERNHTFHHARPYILKKFMNYYQITRIQNMYYWISIDYIIKVLTYILTVVSFALNIGYYFRFSRILRKERPDVVHINDSYDALWISVLLGKNIVYHLHRPRNSLSLFHRYFFKKVDVFIAVSEYVKQTFPYRHQENIVVLHNPVFPRSCPDHRLLAKSYGITEENKVVSLVGRLEPWKGHMEFLRALQKVVRGNSGVLGMIVGGDLEFKRGYERDLKQYAQELGIAENIIFTGHVQDVACIYEMSDVVVHASIKPEAFGLVIVEAMSFGKPVIVSSLGAPREIVEDGAGGFVVDPRDTDLLAEKINQLLTDRELSTRFGTINRAKAEKYKPESYIEQLDEVYTRLCTGRSTPSYIRR